MKSRRCRRNKRRQKLRKTRNRKYIGGGEKEYPDGRVYNGELVNGIPSGHGV